VIEVGTFDTSSSFHEPIANRTPVTLLDQNLGDRFGRQSKTPCHHAEPIAIAAV